MKHKNINNGSRRRIPWVSALLAALAVGIPAGANAGELTVRRSYDAYAIELQDISSPDGTPFQKINWEGLRAEAEVGQPELPVEYIRFIVPVYSNNFRANIIPCGSENNLMLNSRIFPGQEPQKADGSPAPDFSFPDEEIYGETQEPQAWVVGDGFLDGCNHVVTVAVRPFYYEDGALTAIAYGDIDVTLEYDECGEDEMASKPLFPPRASKYLNLDEMVVNSDYTAQFAPLYSTQEKGATESNPEYYYIIVPENLKSSVDDLAVWKRQKGYHVVVTTIEDILAMPEYAVNSTEELVDEAASLRQYLRDEYEKHSAFFCLLVGNYKTSMPIRKFGSLENDWDKYDYDSYEWYIPSDIYFSDLTSNWISKRSDKNSKVISDLDKVNYNYSPTIYVGRLSLSNCSEIENYLSKLKLYEANPGRGDNDYLGNAFFFEQHQTKLDNHGNPYWYASLIYTSNPVRKEVSKHWNIKLFRDAYEDYPADYSTGAEIIKEISKVGLSSWHGHGSRVSCCINNEFQYIVTESDYDEKILSPTYASPQSKNAIEDLTNYDRPSIVYSPSCTNAPIDKVDFVFGLGHTLAEEFTVGSKHTGGPAFIGNSRPSYMNPISFKDSTELETGVVFGLETTFFKSLFSLNKIGVSEVLSKYKFNYNAYSKYLFRTFCCRLLIGEPEFEIWLGKPKTMTINPFWNGDNFSYSGEYPDSLRISLSDGGGITQTKLITNGNTFSRHPFDSRFSKDYLFSAWASGYLPIIRYFGQNNKLTNVSKKFIVRDAHLGNYNSSAIGAKFEVGENASLKIDAIDFINGDEKFSVEDKGSVDLKCDQKVTLNGSQVKSGGKLSIKAETVTFGNGFKVEKGGTLSVRNNK